MSRKQRMDPHRTEYVTSNFAYIILFKTGIVLINISLDLYYYRNFSSKASHIEIDLFSNRSFPIRAACIYIIKNDLMFMFVLS